MREWVRMVGWRREAIRIEAQKSDQPAETKRKGRAAKWSGRSDHFFLSNHHYRLKMIQQLVRRGLATSSRQGLRAVAPALLSAAPTASAIPARVTASTPSRRQLHLSRPSFAQSTTPNSSLSNPAEEEAQKALDEGTTKLEAGDWEAAKEAYARR